MKLLFVLIAVCSAVFALPATVNANVFQEKVGDVVKQVDISYQYFGIWAFTTKYHSEPFYESLCL